MSLALRVPAGTAMDKFAKAVNRFTREDPTFHIHTDNENGEMVMSGMGELHLEVYAERLRREWKVPVETGEPRVNYRETINTRMEFDYTHKRQSGGHGQYAKIIGYIEPIEQGEDETTSTLQAQQMDTVEFLNQIIGNDVSKQHIPAIEKGFRHCATKSFLSGSPLRNVRMVVTDGKSHEVDSSELAFRTAAIGAFDEAFHKAGATLLEPIMHVTVTCSNSETHTVVQTLTRRKGLILGTTVSETETGATVEAEVGLKNMFGYAADLRSCTQGQGEFSMDFLKYQEMGGKEQEEVVAEYKKKQRGGGEPPSSSSKKKK